MSQIKALVSVEDVAERLGVSVVTLWRMRTAGDFPESMTIGRRSKRWRAKAEDTINAACDFDLTEGFNGKYLQEVCMTMVGPKLRLEMGDAGSPPLIRDEGDPTRELVLMPMRA